MLNTVVKEYSFFEINEGKFILSSFLNDLMVPYLSKVEQNKIAGKISAEKKKQKQNEQLKELESLRSNDSSQQVLNVPSANAEEKKEEENRKKKKISNWLSQVNFNEFKKKLVKESGGKFEFKIPYPHESKLLKNTEIKIKSNGYLYNKSLAKDLTKEQAISVWTYLFEKKGVVLNSVKNIKN